MCLCVCVWGGGGGRNILWKGKYRSRGEWRGILVHPQGEVTSGSEKKKMTEKWAPCVFRCFGNPYCAYGRCIDIVGIDPQPFSTPDSGQ